MHITKASQGFFPIAEFSQRPCGGGREERMKKQEGEEEQQRRGRLNLVWKKEEKERRERRKAPGKKLELRVGPPKSHGGAIERQGDQNKADFSEIRLGFIFSTPRSVM